MEQRKKSAWWDNPLGLGAVGLALLVLGYLAMNFVPQLSMEETEDARRREMLRSGAAQLEKKDPQVAAALRTEGGSSFRTPPFLWPGRLAFIAGCVFVAVAGIRWYRLAQRPEASETEPEEVNEQSEA
jgi:hypothetical protein